MAKIISIGTALPAYCHQQNDICTFMQQAYGLDDADKRKLSFLYSRSGIRQRYSVIDDFSKNSSQWQFIPGDKEEDFPSLDKRMRAFKKNALSLSVRAINDCLDNVMPAFGITHLITVSCTGMSAPGLDLEIIEDLDLSPQIFRTSVNFMGCYAAIHALKLAKMICDSTAGVNVLIVATELCTLHFQKEYTPDNAASGLLFSDGSAAVLVSNTMTGDNQLHLKSFHSHVSFSGKADMGWQLSSKGFLMSLSSYIPQLIKEDIAGLVEKALSQASLQQDEVTHWCIHPGGKKILEVIQRQMGLCNDVMKYSGNVLAEYGNMSSPTILFVLKEIMESLDERPANVLGIAFGPGLTMETFIACKNEL